MKILPKQLNWWENMFEERVVQVKEDQTVSCELYGQVCKSHCEQCPWLTSETTEYNEIACRPPVI
ncbi:hypothetical protein [Bacillus sp. FJAT-44742]|uniref:hypothetical protein n=1 Tax=Bacillus sp. FJAT-44742 TaxID=2014005 RepID=UPI000C240E7F|nr:hypothetical protein [Bacillus sp. FJAT-44742]